MADVKAIAGKPLRQLDTLGGQLKFYVTAIAWAPRAVRRYKKEILRLLAEVTLGSVTHELGSFTTASKAMNAAMKFYYEQRPAAKRRQYE